MKKLASSFVLGFVFLLTSCGPSTVVTGSWKNPAHVKKAEPYKHIFIAAMLSDVGIRTQLEDAIAQKAISRGLVVTKSLDIFPPMMTKKDIPSEEKLMEIIKGTNSDLILTVAVKSIKEETRYVQSTATPMYSPYGYGGAYGGYGGFYGYYGNSYNQGYYTTDQFVFLETNLYDVETGALAWSAQSTSTNPSDFRTFSREYLYAILDRLKKDGLLRDIPTKSGK